MCESQLYYDEEVQVQTLYEALHEVMLAGKTYAEVVSAAQTWVKENNRHYIRTCVELKEEKLYLVVRTCAVFDQIGKQEYVVADDVQVPAPFLTRAHERLQQQLQ